MEIGIREWLIVIGAMLLLAVLIDGFRRMRSARSTILPMSKSTIGGGFEKSPIECSTAELPKGKARVIAIRNPTTGAVQPVSSDRNDRRVNRGD